MTDRHRRQSALGGELVDADAIYDDELASRSRRGDPRALAGLYRRYAPPLLGYLLRILGNRSDAEDVLHETFLRLFEGRGQYSARGRFRAWLFTVATHIARDRLKQTRRRDELLAEAADRLRPCATPDPLDDVAHLELLRRVESVLADVPPAYAIAFHLRIRESLSYREIAAICDEPEGTLRSRVHHALKRVRLLLLNADPANADANNPDSAGSEHTDHEDRR
jgi:RNA polymerase sigma-70 factor (ECF subfamily)